MNPIETAFSLIKRYFYADKLKIAANPHFNENGKNLNDVLLRPLVVRAIEAYRNKDYSRIIAANMGKWREFLQRGQINEQERFEAGIKVPEY